MRTRRIARPDLSEESRQERQEEVYRLHCRGLSVRAIGAEMGLEVSQVHRALTQAKAVIRKQQGAEHLAELADRLTEGAWEVISRTYGDTDSARESGDWKAVASLAGIQAKMRELIAKFNGLDPHRVAELELKRQELELKRRAAEAAERNAKTGEGLLEQLIAAGFVCSPPTGPESS